MAGKEGPRGPLTAAHEFSKHKFVVEDRRLAERQELGEHFADLAGELLTMHGISDEEHPNIYSTPEVMFETGRGNVIVSVVGTINPNNNEEYFKLRLDTRYGEFKDPFLPPDKPPKPTFVEVQFSEETGKMLNSEFDLPKTKRLRKAINILDVLTDYFNNGGNSAVIHYVNPQEAQS